MQITRRLKRIKVGERLFIIQQLFPADFMGQDSWPWNIFRVKDKATESQEEPQEDLYAYGRKPKSQIEQERSEEDVKYQAISMGIVSPRVIRTDEPWAEGTIYYWQIFEDKALHNRIMLELYLLAYELNEVGLDLNKIGHALAIQSVISEDVSRVHLEWLYVKAKNSSQEPYALFTDAQNAKPELYHPRRYNFNQTVLVVGKEAERRVAEAQREADRGGQ